MTEEPKQKKTFDMISGRSTKTLLKHELSPVNFLEQYESGTELNDVPAKNIEDEIEARYTLNWLLDRKIQEVNEKLIENTSVNRQWCYDADNLCQMVSSSISRLLIGDGITIFSENEDVSDYLTEWNKNVRKTPSIYSINAMIRDVITDNLVHSEALFAEHEVVVNELDMMDFSKGSKKTKLSDGLSKTLAVFRIDLRTTRVIEHDFLALRKWLQYAYIPSEFVDEKNREPENFYSEDYKPGGVGLPDSYARTTRAAIHETQILDTDAVHFNLFPKAPIATVMQEIIYKKWIIWAMRVAAERTAIPERWARVGTETDHPPADQYEAVLLNALALLQKSRGGDVHAIPYNWEFGHIDMSRAKMDFVSELSYLNEQIVLGLGSHMALYQASGSDLATSTVIEDMLVRSIIGIREELTIVLMNMYRKVLQTADIDPTDDKNEFEIIWSPLKADAYSDYVNVITSLANTEINGKPILKDRNEARKMLENFLGLEQIENDDEEDVSDFPVDDDDNPTTPEEPTLIPDNPENPIAATEPEPETESTKPSKDDNSSKPTAATEENEPQGLHVKCREGTFKKELEEAKDPNHKLFWTMDKVRAVGDVKKAKNIYFSVGDKLQGSFEIKGYGKEKYRGKVQEVVYFKRKFTPIKKPEAKMEEKELTGIKKKIKQALKRK
jgi:hypothetical protein